MMHNNTDGMIYPNEHYKALYEVLDAAERAMTAYSHALRVAATLAEHLSLRDDTELYNADVVMYNIKAALERHIESSMELDDAFRTLNGDTAFLFHVQAERLYKGIPKDK